MIPVIQTIPEQLISSINSIYKIPFINPIKFIAWRSILKSNIEAKDFFNYSTFPNTNKDYLIINNSLLINSIKRMELDSNQYYKLTLKYPPVDEDEREEEDESDLPDLEDEPSEEEPQL